jgi:hypothetical protein
MDEKQILEVIFKYVEIKEDIKYLTCAKAFQIADELNVNASIIGRLCNQEKIKLKSCQLGCF